MKNLKYLALFFSFLISAQEINTDLLKAPASPASNLLGIASSDINKPTDVTDVMLSLQNLSTNFFKEGAYSMEIAPYWIFPSKTNDKTIGQMFENKYNIPQTLVLSIAVKNTDSISTDLPANSIFTGIGFKFSVLRGKATDETKSKHIKIKTLLGDNIPEIENKSIEIIDKDEKLRQLKADRTKMIFGLPPAEQEKVMESPEYNQLKDSIQKRDAELKAIVVEDIIKRQKYADNLKQIKELYNNFEIKRTGFLLDFAGGTSIQFQDKMVDHGKIYNIGVWSVFGYSFEKVGTPLLLLRYMYNPDKEWLTTSGIITEDKFSTFDAGLKYQYSPEKSKFTGSVEGIYRSFISGADYKPDWKFIFNLDYEIWANNHITLSLGKEFDNKIIKNGNAIAALSFVTGIGNKRAVK